MTLPPTKRIAVMARTNRANIRAPVDSAVPSPSTEALAIQSFPAPSVRVAPSTTTPISSVRAVPPGGGSLGSLGLAVGRCCRGDVRQEVARRHQRHDGNHSGHDQQVDRQADSNGGEAGADQGANEGPAAEGGVELWHDGAPQLVLDVGSFDVLGDVPEPDADAEEEQAYCGARNGFGRQAIGQSPHRRASPACLRRARCWRFRSCPPRVPPSEAPEASRRRCRAGGCPSGRMSGAASR